MLRRLLALSLLLSMSIVPAQAISTSFWASASYFGGTSWSSGYWNTGSTWGGYGGSYLYAPVAANYTAPTSYGSPVAGYTQPATQTPKTTASYIAAKTSVSRPVATYTDNVTHASVPSVSYTSSSMRQIAPSATYMQSASKPASIVASYEAPKASALPSANYTAPQANSLPTATYSAPVQGQAISVNYTPPSASRGEIRANYTSPASPAAIKVTYMPPVASSSTIQANYTGGTGSASSGIRANYLAPQASNGAAFGSLFGDGSGDAYGSTASESFVNRLMGQSSPSYTYRAQTLDTSLGNYGTYTPASSTYTSGYDRTFSTGAYGNLNATPRSVVTSGGAVANSTTTLELGAPLVEEKPSYTSDRALLVARGILPASWNSRVGTTLLSRRDIAVLTSRLRAWRDTGKPVATNWTPAEGVFLPILTDLANADPDYRFFLDVTNKRILYMPELREMNGRLVSAKAEANNPALRGQSLQAIMTALYLRPVKDFSGSAMRDLPRNAWYTAWAETAASYGLDFGTTFASDARITQEEAVHMAASLLSQIR